MKNQMRDSNSKKQSTTTKILISPNSTSNKSGQRVIYSKRGVSNEPYRDPALQKAMSEESEPEAITGLIHQVSKGSRPLTGNMIYNQNQQNSNPTMNSPRPNSERVAYSLSPNRSQLKNAIKYLPPKSKQHLNKKTLVLDLDETLVHSGFKPFSTNSDIILKIDLDNRIHDIHVLVRPGVEEFLEKMAKHYELVIFTASLSKYADPLVDKLDPRRVCVYRLFRQHCTEINRAFVKDLRRLDRDLKDVIILDNSPISYALNVENGMPIKNWYEDRTDRELYNMTPILEFLAKVPDVRDFIKRMTDKNELSYSKALQVMNHYNTNSQAIQAQAATPDSYKNLTLINPLSPSLNQSKNKNIKDYIYKPSTQNAESNLEQKYSSNLMRERSNSKGSGMIGNNINTLNYHSVNQDKNAKKDINDKQNINIVLINNHINRYVINPQENGPQQEQQVKKNKSINTFRNSFMTNNNPYYNEVSDYIKNNYPATNLQNRNQENPNVNHYLNNKFSKNINSNFGTEMKSPVLKNSNSNNNGLISNIPSTISKYSSLIDSKMNQMNNQSSRPSSAIMVKGRHIREGSTSSYKNDNNNSNGNNPFTQMTRSPSSQNVPQLIKRNSTNSYPLNKPNMPKRETPRNNYLLSLDPTKGGNTPVGNRTMRPSSTVERVKINYASNLNPLSSMNHNTKVTNRYEEFEAMNRRGYSLSSRANDLKSQSLKYSDQKYNTPSNKFSASGIYRSNGNSTSKQK